ncbi:predicted protein [Nematostella vectensis]|uniref:Uncharacterized protein n=1 Tax=Nematostella vectensis TaxID=45351 RepID=A7S6R6_NEMVE|nr:predicted protein [Nematostella vectensis]|eukprot:XP_001632637.1 predicted protein [Nematostella vectensis]
MYLLEIFNISGRGISSVTLAAVQQKEDNLKRKHQKGQNKTCKKAKQKKTLTYDDQTDKSKSKLSEDDRKMLERWEQMRKKTKPFIHPIRKYMSEINALKDELLNEQNKKEIRPQGITTLSQISQQFQFTQFVPQDCNNGNMAALKAVKIPNNQLIFMETQPVTVVPNNSTAVNKPSSAVPQPICVTPQGLQNSAKKHIASTMHCVNGPAVQGSTLICGIQQPQGQTPTTVAIESATAATQVSNSQLSTQPQIAKPAQQHLITTKSIPLIGEQSSTPLTEVNKESKREMYSVKQSFAQHSLSTSNLAAHAVQAAPLDIQGLKTLSIGPTDTTPYLIEQTAPNPPEHEAIPQQLSSESSAAASSVSMFTVSQSPSHLNHQECQHCDGPDGVAPGNTSTTQTSLTNISTTNQPPHTSVVSSSLAAPEIQAASVAYSWPSSTKSCLALRAKALPLEARGVPAQQQSDIFLSATDSNFTTSADCATTRVTFNGTPTIGSSFTVASQLLAPDTTVATTNIVQAPQPIEHKLQSMALTSIKNTQDAFSLNASNIGDHLPLSPKLSKIPVEALTSEQQQFLQYLTSQSFGNNQIPSHLLSLFNALEGNEELNSDEKETLQETLETPTLKFAEEIIYTSGLSAKSRGAGSGYGLGIDIEELFGNLASPSKDPNLCLPATLSLPNSPSLSSSLLSDWLAGQEIPPADMEEIQKELEYNNTALGLFPDMGAGVEDTGNT